jgi:hypothetical protein
MSTATNGKRKAYQVAAKVDADLKRRIDEFAVQYGMEPSEAIRTLLSFAVMQNEDPKTRIMYALYNNLNVRCYRLLQAGLEAGMGNINKWLIDSIGKAMREEKMNIPNV